MKYKEHNRETENNKTAKRKSYKTWKESLRSPKCPWFCRKRGYGYLYNSQSCIWTRNHCITCKIPLSIKKPLGIGKERICKTSNQWNSYTVGNVLMRFTVTFQERMSTHCGARKNDICRPFSVTWNIESTTRSMLNRWSETRRTTNLLAAVGFGMIPQSRGPFYCRFVDFTTIHISRAEKWRHLARNSGYCSRDSVVGAWGQVFAFTRDSRETRTRNAEIKHDNSKCAITILKKRLFYTPAQYQPIPVMFTWLVIFRGLTKIATETQKGTKEAPDVTSSKFQDVCALIRYYFQIVDQFVNKIKLVPRAIGRSAWSWDWERG